MQLAYVVAHAPGAATGRDEYASGLQQFHDALAAASPNGFLDSWVWHVPEAAPVGSFEDWYLVEDWTALARIFHEHDHFGRRRGSGPAWA